MVNFRPKLPYLLPYFTNDRTNNNESDTRNSNSPEYVVIAHLLLLLNSWTSEGEKQLTAIYPPVDQFDSEQVQPVHIIMTLIIEKKKKKEAMYDVLSTDVFGIINRLTR